MTKLLLKKWPIGQAIISAVSFLQCHLFPQGSKKQGQFLAKLIMLKEQILPVQALRGYRWHGADKHTFNLAFSRFYQLLYSSMLQGSSFSGSITAKICLPNILVHLIEKLKPPLVWKELCRVSHLMSKSCKAFCPDG